MKHVPVGYQLYSAREDVQKDMLSVLKELKRLGYDGVEFAGFFGHTAQEVKSMLDETGLVAVSSHVPLTDIEADMFGTIAYHQQIGCQYIAVPYLDDAHRPGAAGFAKTIALIYRFGALCREAGVVMTGAGATYPYGVDPNDSNMRIAPSLPLPEVLRQAMDVYCVCLRLAALEKLLQK